jgi:hypothetical protein
MKYPGKRQSLPLNLLALLLSGCGAAGPECDSSDTRNSVVTIVSSNSHNALVTYAAKHSSTVQSKMNGASTDTDKSNLLEEAIQRASYAMGDSISTNSRSKSKHEVTCSGVLSATVDDATAQKQVDFKIVQAPDGTVSITVTPFRF